jgi:hypothetical protein
VSENSAGALGIEHNINNYTDKLYLVLRQEEKSKKQFNSVPLNYHTIQLSRKNTAQKKVRNDNKSFTIKKRVELKFWLFSRGLKINELKFIEIKRE